MYAVHKTLEPTSGSIDGDAQPVKQGERPTEFIGLVTLTSLEGGGLALPENLTIPAADATTTLSLELAYQFLPRAWGQGYAAESLKALFEACKRAPAAFWAPFSKVYVRAIVNDGNPASLRVMEKAGVTRKGLYYWTGKVWLAGGWREEDDLHIFGMYLLE